MTPADSSINMKLTDKVCTVLAAQAPAGFVDPVQAVSVYPRADEAGLTEFEMDCRDWGFVFGVTYGIARGEEPYESDDSVCERAMMAAREAFARFSKADIFTADAFEKDRSVRPAPSTAQDEDGGDAIGEGDRVDAAA